MNQLRTLKKLILGETWVLPSGVAAVVAAGALASSLGGTAWDRLGGFALLAGTAAVLLLSVARTARRR